MNLDPGQLTLLSLGLLALALLLLAGLLMAGELGRSRRGAVMGRALQRAGEAASAAAATLPPVGSDALFDDPAGPASAQERDLPVHWLDSRVGRMLVADEDRRLIEQCGFPLVRAQLAFLVLRIVLAVLLPLVTSLVIVGSGSARSRLILLAAAFGLGFMLPKWVLSMMAARRRERVAAELPLFVDLLRLLQGVGLSLDQSLQIMATDFDHVLRVLSEEIRIANRQYAQGRTREHSLQRLATLHANENLGSLVALLVQIDRHGGAVQEPLRQYSERLREHRRADLKERIGKITVKMTGIMVTTLLPALVIVTAGPGFLAIIRSLGSMAK